MLEAQVFEPPAVDREQVLVGELEVHLRLADPQVAGGTRAEIVFQEFLVAKESQARPGTGMLDSLGLAGKVAQQRPNHMINEHGSGETHLGGDADELQGHLLKVGARRS